MTEHLLKVGDEAPNFDLASTEGVVLMLRDEVPRAPVVLFFFPQAAAVEADLPVLESSAERLARSGIKMLGICESPLEELRAMQLKGRLPFPLLHDDRGFSRQYGAGSEGPKTVVVVDRDQRVAWIEPQTTDVARALEEALEAANKASTRAPSYPRSVINRLVHRWVN